MDKHKTCGTCGGVIGNLEKPEHWKNLVVCPPCYAKLRSAELGQRRKERDAEGPSSSRRGQGGSMLGALLKLFFLIGAVIVVYFLYRRFKAGT